MDAMSTVKDKVAIAELETVIQHLEQLLGIARKNLGKVRPIIYYGEIELAKDHLDLVAKYSKI